jgi:hypothetical protein
MLNAHETITNPGETDFIFDYLTRGPNANEWVCDLDALRNDRIFQAHNLTILNSKDGKEIALNFVEQLNSRARRFLCLSIHGHADKVAAVFPGSKIIHIVRDPRDVTSSCIKMGWAGNTFYGIDQWLDTEANWESSRALFKIQDVLEIRFEELIADTQAQLKRVCQFIGVPFSPSMLNYSASTTYAPPDSSAIQPWKTKLTPREIALIELKAKPLLLSRDYALSGNPLDPPGLAERLSLFWSNKTYKWKFGFGRYGAVNFLMEKVTRRLSKPWHSVFVQRMNEIDKRHLK